MNSTEIVLLKDEEHDLDKCRVIARTNKDLNVYSLLILGGRKYIVSQKNLKTGRCGVREIDKEAQQELEYESEFTCPYCGGIWYDAWELEDYEGETECGSCGVVLQYERHVEVTYSTKVKEIPNVIIIEE